VLGFDVDVGLVGMQVVTWVPDVKTTHNSVIANDNTEFFQAAA